MSTWTRWMDMCFVHEIRTPVSACGGYLTMMHKSIVGDDATIRGPKITTMAREAEVHLAKLVLFVNTVSSVLTHERVAEVLRDLADLFKPHVEIVVPAGAQHITCPNDDIKPILWMLVQTQIRSSRADGGDWGATLARITVAIGDRNCCQIVIGPDERERGPDWANVTERACGQGGWLSDVAAALRAGGQELHVRSNGPLAEMTVRWYPRDDPSR